MRQLITEDVFGMAEYEWTPDTQRLFRLTKAQINELEKGNVIRTPLKGGTEFYLSAPIGDEFVHCPKCGHEFAIEESHPPTKGKTA